MESSLTIYKMWLWNTVHQLERYTVNEQRSHGQQYLCHWRKLAFRMDGLTEEQTDKHTNSYTDQLQLIEGNEKSAQQLCPRSHNPADCKPSHTRLSQMQQYWMLIVHNNFQMWKQFALQFFLKQTTKPTVKLHMCTLENSWIIITF